MRILFFNELCDPRIGSSVRQMYQEAARLRESGHATAVVSVTQERGAVGASEILGTTVFQLFSDYELRWRGWVSLDNPQIREPLAELLASWKPDVVHTHLVHTHLGYGSIEAAHDSGAAVVFTAHDVMTFCYQKLTCFHGGEAAGGLLRDYAARWQKCIPCQRLRYNPWRNAHIRRVLESKVERLTVVSDELGAVLRANRIRVDRTIYNAIEPIEPRGRLPDAAKIDAFRQRLGLAGCRVLAIGGRLHEQKGVQQLFKMLALLRGEFPDLRLIVMGKRDLYEREFAPSAKQLGVHDLIVPTGWLDGDELQCAYALCEVFVTPSICFDTFGLVNLEAMQHSKPVVATLFGGSQEVVQAGSTGYIENPFDVPAYAARIRELLLDPERARRLGASGYQRLLEHFTIERLTREFLEEYQLALELRRGR